MNLIEDLEKIERPLRNPVLTIGNFDGVHKGHLVLFNKAKERARAIYGQSAVMTFEPHPIKVMKPGNGPPLITPIGQKLRLIRDSGIDTIFCIPFTREFAAFSAQEFVRDILVDKIGIREVVVGYDYTFGHNRQGNINLLNQLGAKHHFMVHVMDPVTVDGNLVSSTSIRKLVQEGNLRDATRLLGRHYQISGTVIKGMNRGGRLLGFPTANLQLVDELIPKKGVYIVTVFVDKKSYYGVTNIGFNPTFGDGRLSIETHLLDFDDNLLGKTIKVNFLHRLRDEKTFHTVDELIRQIEGDIRLARKMFRPREED